ncbi:MAG: DUF4136 domain-containing protein [Candidatus Eisenbacteria bacterium]|nr:DUF4136 domain-containing protein [Candidatus Eisenbacteria bacterium]
MRRSNLLIHRGWGPMMRGATALVVFGLTLAALAGCSRVSVRSMADPDVDFGRFATFAFLPDGGRPPEDAPPPRHLSILQDPRYHASLQEAIGSALVERGFRPARAEAQPDLWIAYHTVIRDQADVMPALYGVGWRGRMFVASPGYVRWYKEGTLVIDIVDAADDRLVWRGVGVGAMCDMRPGTPMNEAVEEILDEFPPE